ncbi:hypothetical protein GCM10020219_043030 [Nonomuraea dietziae]
MGQGKQRETSLAGEEPVRRDSDAEVETTLQIFYTTERAGAAGLSDGGGPFGFDVTVALLVNDLLAAYRCDAIVETGCYLGDTTTYLARRYPALPVHTCDVVAEHVAFTRQRMALAGVGNVQVEYLDSPALVRRVDAAYRRPLYFLDAHWEQRWPLAQELAAIRHGVVLIDDFDIGHPRFAFDTYDGLACGPHLLARLQRVPSHYFTPSPDADWPLPCLQVGRRAGVGILPIGVDSAPLENHPHLLTRPVSAEKATTP